MLPLSTARRSTSPLTDLSKSPTPPTDPSFWQGISSPKPVALKLVLKTQNHPSKRKNALEKYAEPLIPPKKDGNKRQRAESLESPDSTVIADGPTEITEPTRKKAKKSGEFKFVPYQPPPPTKTRSGRQSKPTQKAVNLQSPPNGDLPTPPSTDNSLLSIPTSPQSSPIPAARANGKKNGNGKGKAETYYPKTVAEIDAELDKRPQRSPMAWSKVTQNRVNEEGHLVPLTGPSAEGGVCLPKFTKADIAAMKAGSFFMCRPVITPPEPNRYISSFDDEIRELVASDSSKKRTRRSAVASAEPEQPPAKKAKTAAANESAGTVRSSLSPGSSRPVSSAHDDAGMVRFSLSPELSAPVSSVRDDPAPHLDFGRAMNGYSDVRSSSPPISSVRDEPILPRAAAPTTPNRNTNGYISPSSSDVTEPESPSVRKSNMTTAAGNDSKKGAKVTFAPADSSTSQNSSSQNSTSSSEDTSDTGKKPYVSPYATTSTPPQSTPPPTHYFAYGVDMSPTYMSTHYPGSQFVSGAKLSGYKWTVGEKEKVKAILGSEGHVIWGALYTVTPTQLKHLTTKGEKAPRSCTMALLPLSLFSRDKKIGWYGNETEECLIPGGMEYGHVLIAKGNEEGEGEVRKLGKDSKLVKRYNRAIVDMCEQGIDCGWLEKVVRKWVPRLGAGDGLYW